MKIRIILILLILTSTLSNSYAQNTLATLYIQPSYFMSEEYDNIFTIGQGINIKFNLWKIKNLSADVCFSYTPFSLIEKFRPTFKDFSYIHSQLKVIFPICDSGCLSFYPHITYVHLENNIIKPTQEFSGFLLGAGFRVMPKRTKFFIDYNISKNISNHQNFILNKYIHQLACGIIINPKKLRLSIYLGNNIKQINPIDSPLYKTGKNTFNRLEGGLIAEFYVWKKLKLSTQILNNYQRNVLLQFPDNTKIHQNKIKISEDISYAFGINYPQSIKIIKTFNTEFELSSIYLTQRLKNLNNGKTQLNALYGYQFGFHLLIPKVFDKRFYLVFRLRYIPNYYHYNFENLLSEHSGLGLQDQWNFSIGAKIAFLKNNGS